MPLQKVDALGEIVSSGLHLHGSLIPKGFFSSLPHCKLPTIKKAPKDQTHVIMLVYRQFILAHSMC